VALKMRSAIRKTPAGRFMLASRPILFSKGIGYPLTGARQRARVLVRRIQGRVKKFPGTLFFCRHHDSSCSNSSALCTRCRGTWQPVAVAAVLHEGNCDETKFSQSATRLKQSRLIRRSLNLVLGPALPCGSPFLVAARATVGLRFSAQSFRGRFPRRTE